MVQTSDSASAPARQHIPPEVEARLLDSLQSAQRPARARRLLKNILLPLPALAAAVLLFLLSGPLQGFAPVVEEAVDQHCQQVPVEVPSDEAREVDDWFKDKLSFDMAAPRFQRATLLGGRLSRLAREGFRDRSAAYLIYGVDEHKLTVLIFDGRDIELEQGAEVYAIKGRRLAMYDRGAYRVALFNQGPVGYAVTSDLSSKDLIQVVSSSF